LTSGAFVLNRLMQVVACLSIAELGIQRINHVAERGGFARPRFVRSRCQGLLLAVVHMPRDLDGPPEPFS
jgi:hypothetical protein